MLEVVVVTTADAVDEETFVVHPLGKAGAVTASNFSLYGRVTIVGSAAVVKLQILQPVASP